MPLPSNSTITIQRQVPRVNQVGANHPAEPWPDRLTGVRACRIPVSADSQAQFSREDIVANYEWVTETDVGATTQDRVVSDGKYYEVLGYKEFNSPFSGRVLYVTITGRRNQP